MASTSEPTGTLATRLQAAVQARGQRWTEQRQLIADVLAASDGHATGAELVERVRAADPSATLQLCIAPSISSKSWGLRPTTMGSMAARPTT